MATIKTKTSKISNPSNETKYKVADAIASMYQVSPEAVSSNYNYYFREVIQSPISIKGVVNSIENHFDEDSARHITALVLKRLSTPKLQARAVAKVDL